MYERFKQFLRKQLAGLMILLLLLLLVTIYLWDFMFITILPGEAGVFWGRFTGGTRTDYVYPEGMHVIFPWDKMYLYNIRVQQTPHEFSVLTRSGLRIHLAISVRYYPEMKMLGVLHQKVGPDYVDKVVIPEIESVLRVLIGQLEAEEVFRTDKAIIEKSVNRAVEQIAQRFINVDNVIIKRMDFPPVVARAIENKIEQKQLAEAHLFRVEREKYEAERKRIESEGYKRYNEILQSSLTDRILRWREILATLELATSANAKSVILGCGKEQFQLFGSIPLEPETTPGAFSPSLPGLPEPGQIPFTPAGSENQPFPESSAPEPGEPPEKATPPEPSEIQKTPPPESALER